MLEARRRLRRQRAGRPLPDDRPRLFLSQKVPDGRCGRRTQRAKIEGIEL